MNTNGRINPLFDPTTDNLKIADDVQEMLNKSQAGGQVSAEDREFLDRLMKLVEDGTIKLHAPSTLLNTAVYDGLAPKAKAKADQNALIMLGKIREIVDLEKAPMDTNYQEVNLVGLLRQNKERLEEHGGDIFII